MTPAAIRARASRAAKINKLSKMYRLRITNRTLDKIIADLEAKRPDIRDGLMPPEEFDRAIAQVMADTLEAVFNPPPIGCPPVSPRDSRHA